MHLNGVETVLVVPGAGSAAYGFYIDIRLICSAVFSGEGEERDGAVSGGDHHLRIHLGESAEDDVGDTLRGRFSVAYGSRFGRPDQTSRFGLDLDAVKEA